MAFNSLRITGVSEGSITSDDRNLTFTVRAFENGSESYNARPVQIQASADGGATWTSIGSFQAPAVAAGAGPTHTWTGTIAGIPAQFADVNDASFVFRASMDPQRAGDGAPTLVSANSSRVAVDTTADSGEAATVTFQDAVANADEATEVTYTVSGLDPDADALIMMFSSGGGDESVAVEVTGNGTYSVDLSGLPDGTISTTIVIDDDAGGNLADGSNTLTRTGGTVGLDTTADGDVKLDLTGASATADDASVAFDLNNLDAGSTATVTFTGAGGGTATTTYTTNGAKTADVSGLTGDITAAVSVTDAAGNVAAGAGDTLAGDPVCFYPGTLVAVPGGERPVEALRAGDLVLTADGRTQPVRWLGRQTVSTRFADPLRVLPVRIAAGALGEGLPRRDLLVSPCHALLLDGALAQAGALVNGATVRREAGVPEVFTYWHVELADHALVLAEGVPAETFVDNVSRLAFDNWDEHEAAAAGPAPVAEMALPRAKSARQVPAATRRRLAERAAALATGGRATAAA